MTKSKRVIIGLAAGLILIVAGLAAGILFRKSIDEIAVQSVTHVAENKSPVIAQKENPAPNLKIYTASPPSQGRAYIATPITFENIFASHAVVMMEKKGAAEILPGQKILLYGADGALLDAVGIIDAIEDGKGENKDSKIIRITLNPLPDGKFPAPVRGEIVTNDMPQTHRLPVTALQTDKDGNSYIWEAITQNGRRIAKKRAVNGLAKPGAYFIMNRPEYISNVYILNPDDALRDGQVIKIEQTLYSPGLVPSVEQIATIPREPPEINLADRPAIPGAACATTCNAGAGGAAGFIQHIKELGETMPKQSRPADSTPTP